MQNSDLLICMAGTAAEQAVGLCKPVGQLVGKGPQFTASFAEAQRRLLGPTIFCVQGVPGAEKTLSDTSNLVLEVLHRSQDDKTFQQLCKIQANSRLGGKGGSDNIAKTISSVIN